MYQDRSYVEVRWTTERNGKATRHAKTIEVHQLDKFLAKLEAKDAYQIDTSRWA